MENKKLESSDLSIPIYLNQQIVFDMLAVLEDGFSMLRNVETATSQNKNQENVYQTSLGNGVGVSNVFAFLGMGFKADHRGQKETEQQEKTFEERVYTPVSLFARLRMQLKDKNMIYILTRNEDISELKSGQFVEFNATLRPNPLINVAEGIKVLISMAAAFGSFGQEQVLPANRGSGKGKPQNRQPQSNESNQVKQIEKFLDLLTEASSQDFIGEVVDSDNLRTVISTRPEFFINRDGTEVIDGEFKVLGKVIQVVTEGNQSINLLRKTNLRLISEDNIEEIVNQLNSSDLEGFALPKVETRIKAPALQILPIAIFS